MWKITPPNQSLIESLSSRGGQSKAHNVLSPANNGQSVAHNACSCHVDPDKIKLFSVFIDTLDDIGQ